MKFHWFHLMPWPYLPDDFRERHRSVWVDLPAALYDPVRGHALYNRYLDQLEHAERMGFDGLGVNEHHQNAYGLMPSPNLMAAALTRRTAQAKLVVLGDSVALYNPPTRVAEELAMLDVMSGGRVVAGFPVGTQMDTTYCYGQTPATLREKYREGVELILRSWTAREPFPFNGTYTQLRYVNVWPRPLQTPHPPVWVPGGGSVETWDYCVDHDFLYAYLSYWGWPQARRVMDAYWETVERKGAEPNPYRAACFQFVAVADTDAEAERLYAEHALYFFNRCLHVYPGFAAPPGYVTSTTMRTSVPGQVRAARSAMSDELTWRDLIERGYVVAGSAATVIDRLGQLAETLRTGHLIVGCHFGSMPHETVLRNTTLFAERVMPALRERFNEWHDRWSPATQLDPTPTSLA